MLYPQRDLELPQLAASPNETRQVVPLSSNPREESQLLAGAQRPSTHASPVAHARSHAPHAVASLRKSTQRAPHAASGGRHRGRGTHRPRSHTSVDAQRVEQVPQVASALKFASQPLAGFVSQSPYPLRHTRPQLPPETQSARPLAGVGHTLPHPPQFDASVSVGTSQPLAVLPSQSAKPAAQLTRHTPPTHDAELPTGAVHATTVYPSPSTLHTRRSVIVVHDASPGTQTRVRHAPITHDSPAAHAAVL